MTTTLSEGADVIIHRRHHVRRGFLFALCTTFAAAACSSEPTMPPVDEPPTGTLLLRGAFPGSGVGLFTFQPVGAVLSPIASGDFALSSRLSPDGLTAYTFDFPVGQDVYQLVSSTQLGAENALLQFPLFGWTSVPVGLAIDRSGARVAMLEGSTASPHPGTLLRVHDVGSTGSTNVASFQGVNGGLDWHPDGRRLLTSTYDRVAGQAGRLAIIDVETKAMTLIGPLLLQALSDAVFAPDGRSIVYSTLTADGTEVLGSIGFDGGRATNLPQQLEGSTPTFSPDGRYLAYCAFVSVGTDRRQARFIRRLADGATEQILPPSITTNLGCINDWAR